MTYTAHPEAVQSYAEQLPPTEEEPNVLFEAAYNSSDLNSPTSFAPDGERYAVANVDAGTYGLPAATEVFAQSATEMDGSEGGIGNVVDNVLAGVGDEFTNHFDRVTSSAVGGAAIAGAVVVGAMLAPAVTTLALAGAGIFAVVKIAEALPGLINDIGVAFDPNSHTQEEVLQSEADLRGFGAEGLNLLAGSVAAPIGGIGTKMFMQSLKGGAQAGVAASEAVVAGETSGLGVIPQNRALTIVSDEALAATRAAEAANKLKQAAAGSEGKGTIFVAPDGGVAVQASNLQMANLKTAIIPLVKGAKDTVSSITPQVAKTFDTYKTALVDGVTSGFKKVSDSVSGTVYSEAAKKTADDMLKGLKDSYNSVMSGVRSEINTTKLALNPIAEPTSSTWFQGLSGKAMDRVNKTLTDAGKELRAGATLVGKGLDKFQEHVTPKLAEFVQTAPGMMTVAGVSYGLEGNKALVRGSMTAEQIADFEQTATAAVNDKVGVAVLGQITTSDGKPQAVIFQAVDGKSYYAMAGENGLVARPWQPEDWQTDPTKVPTELANSSVEWVPNDQIKVSEVPAGLEVRLA
ncbi:MAG: hypothetical protein C0469_18015 [Cyanobacteria bacterium DS2.3.42]|nr:hypothetical protein [Cyanobacteria bacterium DS2.3.42]